MFVGRLAGPLLAFFSRHSFCLEPAIKSTISCYVLSFIHVWLRGFSGPDGSSGLGGPGGLSWPSGLNGSGRFRGVFQRITDFPSLFWVNCVTPDLVERIRVTAVVIDEAPFREFARLSLMLMRKLAVPVLAWPPRNSIIYNATI
jgi:hypothetical protein